LFFISLIKWKQQPKKEDFDQGTKAMEELEKQGIKIKMYITLGRYDAVVFMEAPNEKDAMRAMLPWLNIIESETMTAVPRAEAIKLL
jgi:uncharacterized protein with GYD domain